MLTNQENVGSACARLGGSVELSSAEAWVPQGMKGWGEDAADLAPGLGWTLATLRRLGR